MTPQSLFSLAFIHLLAVASPGPDFVLVTRNTLQGSRRIGIATAFGIMAGNAIHIAFFGFAQTWVSASNPAVYRGIQVAGGIYLTGMGLKILKSVLRPQSSNTNPGESEPPSQSHRVTSERAGFLSGLLTTSLNGKAAVYFLTLVSQFVSSEFTIARNLSAVVLMLAISAGWFSLVSTLIGSGAVKRKLESHLHKIDGLMGAVLLCFGLWILFAK
jgi:threonine/homoserine/homoserine lactone efflux protein